VVHNVIALSAKTTESKLIAYVSSEVYDLKPTSGLYSGS
jgi:hypothetical protein